MNLLFLEESVELTSRDLWKARNPAEGRICYTRQSVRVEVELVWVGCGNQTSHAALGAANCQTEDLLFVATPPPPH